MKAKEYFNQYEEGIVSEYNAKASGETPKASAAYSLFLAMSNEAFAIMKERNCKREASCAGVIREINQKWNAINTLFEKKYKISPIVRNGFINAWVEFLKSKSNTNSDTLKTIVESNRKEGKEDVVSQ